MWTSSAHPSTPSTGPHHDELIAGEAGDGVAVAHPQGKSRGHLDKDCVPGGMAKVVVHPFELVKRHERYGNTASDPTARSQRLLEAVSEQRAARQICQKVVHLMHRLGHASSAAALVYQHAVNERDGEIARALDAMVTGNATSALVPAQPAERRAQSA